MNWRQPLRIGEASSADALILPTVLPGLPNPAGFLRQLASLVRPDASLFVLDIDRFRALKNSLGYQHANELLRALAARLQSALPLDTLIEQLGEDTFALGFPSVADEAQARALAQAVFVLMQQPFHIDRYGMGGEHISMTVSIGIACVTSNPAVGLRNANTALCRAKVIGPAQIVVYDRAMREGDQRWLQLETELRRALETSQTAMAYQPIVDLETGQVAGHEALMRWCSPTLGVIAPSDFIPLAERAGIAPILDQWAFAQVIKRLQSLPQVGAINVNLSACSLLENSWVDETLARFQASGLRAGQVRLEITETALLNQEAKALSNLNRLCRAGLPVLLDDFGTGYSSLSHLRLFPIAGIKIDRSFVAQITGSGREGRIVSAMTRLALDLGMSVTAEGVENELQHTSLIATGCGFAQGHFYGVPSVV